MVSERVERFKLSIADRTKIEVTNWFVAFFLDWLDVELSEISLNVGQHTVRLFAVQMHRFTGSQILVKLLLPLCDHLSSMQLGLLPILLRLCLQHLPIPVHSWV